jgi:hypothetical protein
MAGSFGAKKNHPDCPADQPHATTDAAGAALFCHTSLSDAQDMALAMTFPDATPAAAPAASPADGVLAAAGDVPPLAAWPDVELVAVGEWDLSSGPASFTTADLQSAVGAADCPAVGRPILKLGHNDPRFDGEPAIGWVAGMRLNDSMTKVIGDFEGMPGWLGEILPSAYPERSVEGGWNFPCQMGHTHPFVITAVALLGATPPGVGIIASLNDIAVLYGIEAAVPADPAALRPFRIQFPGDVMAQAGKTALAAGTNTTIDDVRREFYDAAPWSQWIIELQLDPLVLIVSDDQTGDLYRVPVTIDAKTPGSVTFGDPETVLVQYISAPAVKAEAAKGGPLRRIAAAWASSQTSRAGFAAAGGDAADPPPWDGSAAQKNLGTDPTAAQINALYALPADTKSDSKLPHHDVSSDGKVGAANVTACSAAIGALNGGRGGVAGVSAADKAAAYKHLAKHITDAGGEAPELKAAGKTKVGDPNDDVDPDDADQAGVKTTNKTAPPQPTASGAAPQPGDTCPTCDGSGTINEGNKQCPDCGGTGVVPDNGDSGPNASAGSRLVDGKVVAGAGIEIEAGGAHGPYTGEHDHPHSAYGTQGGDQTHGHMHGHQNDGVHAHVHDPVSSAPTPAAPAVAKKEGNPEMEFTAEQMAAIRTRLGKKDGEEITPADIAAAFASPTIQAGAASPGEDGKLPPIGDGSYLVDSDILRDWQARAAAGDHALHQLRIYERDQVLAEAVRTGKFPQAKLQTYSDRWDRDPEGTRELVGALAAGLVPVGTGPIGHPGYDADLPGDFEAQQAYRDLYPEDAQGPGSGFQGAGARAGGGRRA